ncbi:MAG: single-stranded DNA-binding protein [bacterium]
MANLNRIILVGNLTNDPEVRFTVEGVQVAKFQLAVDRFVQEGAPKQVDYIDIVAWRRLAEICGQSLKKGKTALVEGRIQVRTFENESGVRKWATEVVARSIKLLGAQEQAVKPAQAGTADEVPGIEELPEEESDLPF